MKRHAGEIVEFNSSDGLTPLQVRKLNANIAYMKDLEFAVSTLEKRVAELEKRLESQGG